MYNLTQQRSDTVVRQLQGSECKIQISCVFKLIIHKVQLGSMVQLIT